MTHPDNINAHRRPGDHTYEPLPGDPYGSDRARVCAVCGGWRADHEFTEPDGGPTVRQVNPDASAEVAGAELVDRLTDGAVMTAPVEAAKPLAAIRDLVASLEAHGLPDIFGDAIEESLRTILRRREQLHREADDLIERAERARRSLIEGYHINAGGLASGAVDAERIAGELAMAYEAHTVLGHTLARAIEEGAINLVGDVVGEAHGVVLVVSAR